MAAANVGLIAEQGLCGSRQSEPTTNLVDSAKKIGVLYYNEQYAGTTNPRSLSS